MAAQVPAYPSFPSRPTPEGLNRLFAVQREADPFGHRLHVGCAAVACFLAGFPTTVIEWAGLPLLACFVIRMFTHHRMLGPLVWDPLTRMLVLFIGWLGLSALWTYGGSGNWVQDGQSLRFALLIPAIYPVLDRRGVLVTALVLGLLCGEASQLVHLVSQWAGNSLFDRDPQRISGWWDPVMAGSLLCGCLGLVLGHVRLNERPRAMWVAALVTTLGAIAITGTRGAWIAAVLLVAAAAVLGIVRAGGPARGRRTVIALGGLVGLVALAAIAVMAVPPIRARFDRAVTEVRGAFTSGNYQSDTGLRIAMARWAMIEFAAHPIRGVGAGGYQPFAAARCTLKLDTPGSDGAPPTTKPKRRKAVQEPPRPIDPDTRLPLPHAHAHSWFLHTLATLGAPGLMLLLASLVIAMRPLWSRADDDDRAAYAAALGLLGLTLAGLFDTIHVNQQTAYLLFLLLGLLNSMRPSEEAGGDELQVERVG